MWPEQPNMKLLLSAVVELNLLEDVYYGGLGRVCEECIEKVAKAKVKIENFIAQKNQQASEQYKKTTQSLGDPNRLIEGFLDPKFIYRLHHDPKETFKKIRIPVLVLYGEEDKLVDVNTNLPRFEKSLDSTQHQIKVFPGFNEDDLGMRYKIIKFYPDSATLPSGKNIYDSTDWIMQHDSLLFQFTEQDYHQALEME